MPNIINGKGANKLKQSPDVEWEDVIEYRINAKRCDNRRSVANKSRSRSKVGILSLTMGRSIDRRDRVAEVCGKGERVLCLISERGNGTYTKNRRYSEKLRKQEKRQGRECQGRVSDRSRVLHDARRDREVTTKEEIEGGMSMWNKKSNVPELSQGAKLNSQQRCPEGRVTR